MSDIVQDYLKAIYKIQTTTGKVSTSALAERLEHTLSDDLEERMDDALGHPNFDPHGDPIPNRDGSGDRASRGKAGNEPAAE